MKRLSNIFRDQILEIVQRVSFLSNLTYPELCRFVDLKTHLYSCDENETFIHDGDADASLFILLSGEAGVYKGGTLISTIESGDCIGEISFVTGKPRTADVTAHTQLIVIRLNSAAYERVPPAIREKIKDSIILKLVHRIDLMNQRCAAERSSISYSLG